MYNQGITKNSDYYRPAARPESNPTTGPKVISGIIQEEDLQCLVFRKAKILNMCLVDILLMYASP